MKQGAGVKNIEITEKNIKSFERVAKKYGVDFALKKDPAEGKYYIFFKARDDNVLQAAFAEYTAKTLHRNTPKSLHYWPDPPISKRSFGTRDRTRQKIVTEGGMNVEI